MPDIKATWATINAGIGNWSPEAMEDMTLDDLYEWYDIAVDNIERQNEAAQAP